MNLLEMSHERYTTTKKLARKLAGGGLALHTETSSTALPPGFPLHCSRGIPGWQEDTQGGTPSHATGTLSL